FSPCVYTGEQVVEGIKACLAKDANEAKAIIKNGDIAVLVDPEAKSIKELKPDAIVDAIIAKFNVGTAITDAPIVVALGPGFTAGEDCHCVVETQRGHNLGRCIYSGKAAENTGIPGNIAGYTTERILRAPCDGTFEPLNEIGDIVKKGQVVARVNGEDLLSNLDGIVRGMLQKGVKVHKGMKSGDVDPRGVEEYCLTVSDKGRAIAGGVLEAIMHLSWGDK
ncbi:MAG: selenium-dependent molybdenum cofactor biosynthesis protein YqeB, partial [Oscillospiraceae bacterium]